MKRKKIIIVLFCMILLGIILYFSCRKRPKEISLKNKIYVMELTLNSDLPTYLMEKVTLTEQEKENYFIYKPYLDYDMLLTDPNDAPEYMYITNIVINDGSYNVLGLSIGDDIENVKKTMTQYGYMIDIFYLPYFLYKKGDICIWIDMTSDNHIEEMTIFLHRNTLINRIYFE